ncbi:MAG: hypothetical protein ABI947_24995 [Chloroflexota bacterium]
MEHQWWPGQPVLEVNVQGSIANREQAYALSKSMVDQIEGSNYKHVIVILDLTALGQSPSAAALLGGNLPETLKIEHLVMINAPGLFRFATMPLVHLRHKLHFVNSAAAAKAKATELLPKLQNA